MFEDLNSQQKEAVIHNEGPMLVFAGAGSGKTRVITSRIARLITEGIVLPQNILAVTFTRKAAGEMKERVAKLLSEATLKKKADSLIGNMKYATPYIGTFHSFGAVVLRRESQYLGLPVGFSIYDPNDSLQVIRSNMDLLKLDKKQFNPSAIKNAISSAKNEMIGPSEYRRFVRGPLEEVTAEIYPRYEKDLLNQGAVDFDDLQMLPLKLFLENPDVLEKYIQIYQYILVDEYQDTNTVQYKLIKLLAGKNKNVCVVGDDDQGIYSWRGATIKNILSFERDFAGAKVVKLEKNYRSTKNILHAAYSVIRHNNERAEKELWTDANSGDTISIYEASNDRREAEFVTEKIKSHQRNGADLSDMCILYRTNSQSRAFEESLIRSATSYKLVGGVRFYERREIKDLLAYLRFLANPLDELSFLRVINVPSRRIGPKAIEELRRVANTFGNGHWNIGIMLLIVWGMISEIDSWDKYLPLVNITEDMLDKFSKSADFENLKENHAELISLFGRLYNLSKEADISVLIAEILKQTKYELWIDDGTPQVQERKENIFEFRSVADKHKEEGPRDSLLSFLEDVSLVEQDLNTMEEENAVTLMTLHSAKGLEFDIVFMVGMEEGLFPHSMSFTSVADLEEERRLCYVGITRARKKLYMTFANNRRTYKGFSDRIPSRFLSEIPEDVLEVENYGRNYGW